MEELAQQNIENRIYTLRGVQVMLDSDLAELYGVETKRLNEQVKRNIERFPKSFMFQLSIKEWDVLQSQIATLEERNYLKTIKTSSKSSNFLRSQIATAKRRTLPYVFTELGVAMLSAVLKSETAVKVSIQIMHAFVQIKQLISRDSLLIERVGSIELKQLETDKKIEQIFKAIESRKPQPDKGIFFNSQIFDAYAFVADLIKSAEDSIILIDNYIDDSVLTLLSKRKTNVSCSIYTKTISKQLKLDLEKHNAQYPSILVKTFTHSHDRFLIIDQKELYHFGASLKDLGKKWFAFSKMEGMAEMILKNLL